MGTMDSTIHKLSCKNCNIQEEARILDKGSNWGGSHWQNGPEFTKFQVTWKGGDKTEPTIVTAICRKCGASASTESRFGG